MSTDLTIVHPSDPETDLARVNLTYNLSPMLREAGVPSWTVYNGISAREFGATMRDHLDRMNTEPERYRALNPDNGWGDYDRCLQGRLREFVGQCLVAPPDATICVW